MEIILDFFWFCFSLKIYLSYNWTGSDHMHVQRIWTGLARAKSFPTKTYSNEVV